MDDENLVWRLVGGEAEAFTALADRVFDTPEVAYTEARSCAEPPCCASRASA